MFFEEILAASLITGLTLLLAYLLERKILTIVIAALLTRFLLIFIIENGGPFSSSDLSDYLRYFIPFSQSYTQNPLEFLAPHVPFYTLLYPGWIFAAFGEHGAWVIRVANACVGVLCIFPLNWLNRILFAKDLSFPQLVLILFWPTYLRYTVEVGRSSPTIFFTILGLAASLALMSSARENRTLKVFVTCAVASIFSFYLRTHYIAYFLPLGFLYLLNKIKQMKLSYPSRILLNALAILVGIGASVVLYKLYLAFGPSRTTDYLSSASDITDFVEKRTEGGSAYLVGINPRSPVDWVWSAPLHAIYFTFSPMPWAVRSALMAGSSIQALFIFYLCVRAGRRRKRVHFNPLVLKNLMASLFFVALVFGSVTKNAGSAVRWRLPSTLILLTVSSSMTFIKRQKIASPGFYYTNYSK